MSKFKIKGSVYDPLIKNILFKNKEAGDTLTSDHFYFYRANFSHLAVVFFNNEHYINDTLQVTFRVYMI